MAAQVTCCLGTITRDIKARGRQVDLIITCRPGDTPLLPARRICSEMRFAAKLPMPTRDESGHIKSRISQPWLKRKGRTLITFKSRFREVRRTCVGSRPRSWLHGNPFSPKKNQFSGLNLYDPHWLIYMRPFTIQTRGWDSFYLFIF